jgi:putative SOS response-associated peptidase YedK
MCGRFTLTTGQRAELEARFGAALPVGVGLERLQRRTHGADPRRVRRWRGARSALGADPARETDHKGGAPMINARCERRATSGRSPTSSLAPRDGA